MHMHRKTDQGAWICSTALRNSRTTPTARHGLAVKIHVHRRFCAPVSWRTPMNSLPLCRMSSSFPSWSSTQTSHHQLHLRARIQLLSPHQCCLKGFSLSHRNLKFHPCWLHPQWLWPWWYRHPPSEHNASSHGFLCQCIASVLLSCCHLPHKYQAGAAAHPIQHGCQRCDPRTTQCACPLEPSCETLDCLSRLHARDHQIPVTRGQCWCGTVILLRLRAKNHDRRHQPNRRPQ